MRAYLLLLTTACSAEVGSPTEASRSVRDQLERDDTVLAIRSTDSAGAVTAMRKTGGDWSAGLVDLAILDGELIASADTHGTITLQHLAIDVGPIEVPSSVLGYEVQLTDIHIGTAGPVPVTTTWDGDNEAHGAFDLELELAWSLTNHGSTSPLGAPDLPPVPVEIVLTGDADTVHAELRVQAPGELWSWADLFRLEDLTLILAASN